MRSAGLGGMLRLLLGYPAEGPAADTDSSASSTAGSNSGSGTAAGMRRQESLRAIRADSLRLGDLGDIGDLSDTIAGVMPVPYPQASEDAAAGGRAKRPRGVSPPPPPAGQRKAAGEPAEQAATVAAAAGVAVASGDDVALASQLGPHGRYNFFTNSRGVKIAAYFWPAPPSAPPAAAGPAFGSAKAGSRGCCSAAPAPPSPTLPLSGQQQSPQQAQREGAGVAPARGLAHDSSHSDDSQASHHANPVLEPSSGSSSGGGSTTRPAAGQGPKGIVVAVHGSGGYLCWDFLKSGQPGQPTSYEGSWVQELNRHGYSVCGIDLQGAGRSEGIRCYIERFEHYVEDVLHLARNMHSMAQDSVPAAAQPQHVDLAPAEAGMVGDDSQVPGATPCHKDAAGKGAGTPSNGQAPRGPGGKPQHAAGTAGNLDSGSAWASGADTEQAAVQPNWAASSAAPMRQANDGGGTASTQSSSSSVPTDTAADTTAATAPGGRRSTTTAAKGGPQDNEDKAAARGLPSPGRRTPGSPVDAATNETAAAFRPGLPVFLMGLSLGGGIATHAMMETLGSGLFAGAVLLAPMLSLQGMSSSGTNRLLLPVAWLLDMLLPTLPVVRPARNELFPTIQQVWDADPACFQLGTRVHNGLEFLRACDKVQREMARADFPFIAFHSSRDKWTDASGSRALYEASPSADKALVAVDDMFHVLTKEDGNEHVLDQVLAWLDSHTMPAAAQAETSG